MNSAAPTTRAEYWDKYKPHRGQGDQPRPTARAFDWTGLADGGPGAEVLGDPATALDLGPAEGENAAGPFAGVEVTAVDFSAVQIERARRFWADEPRLTSVHAEACAYLDEGTSRFEAIYSTWGAVWFTDPEELFPRIDARLSPGGGFAFSHREPIAGSTAPSGWAGNGWRAARAS
ncbi:class I SAM-dependent methyltransferase [Streptomyces sp. LMG1-1-1.1]|uniref:class I SAM-dependent methyltransferase n=1 Tax=Streptomyces sp. LMG1-1-1.1 TaxID=3135245 RepID=UPI00346621A8